MEGSVAAEFQSVADTLERQIAEAGVGGAAVAVYHAGRSVVDVWDGAMHPDGTPWQREALAMSYSTTKGVTSTALHMCVDRGLLDYDDRVAEHWPEFAQNGKEAITVRQVLCHEAGLYPIRSLIEHARVMNDWDAMVQVLERAEPVHTPGHQNGYHGLTFGWLVGELIRRTSGRAVDDFVREEIAEPLGLSGLFMGLPDSERGRLATLIFPDSDPLTQADAGATPVGNPIVALAEQMGLEIDLERIIEALLPHGMTDWVRDPESLRTPVPAANGCFTARSLARMYAALAEGGTLEGVRLLSEVTLKRAAEVQNSRPDLVIVMPMQWRLGYHPAFTTKGLLNSSFGHSGFGGSGAWADPIRDLSLALTVNRIAGTAVGDMRIAELSAAAVKSAKGAA